MSPARKQPLLLYESRVCRVMYASLHTALILLKALSELFISGFENWANAKKSCP